MAFIDTFPPESTSSLTRDIWEGKPSELEYQNGAVVKLAEKHELEVPVNKFIYHCLLPSENRVREKLNRN
jgi:2-dehydropantoate 2-reductase